MTFAFSAKDIAMKIGLDLPTAEQERIIEAPLTPSVVIAGAGSGKTETMSSRLVFLVANGQVTPDQVLGLTFTKKAATELSHRVRRRLVSLNRAGLIGEINGDISISTYHSYAGRILGEHALRIGVEPPSRLAGEARVWLLADRIVSRYDGPMSITNSNPSTVTGYVIGLANEMAEHGISIEQVDEFTRSLIADLELIKSHDKHGIRAQVREILDRQRSRLELLPLVSLFQEAKRIEGELSFDDQMSLAARIAIQVPAVGELERSRYQVVLLDEYQDTSQSQLILMKSLFGDGHPVTAVGDPCQSIYGWRGASAHTLESFPTDFPCVDGTRAEIYPLMISWRNDTSILAAANSVSNEIRALTDAPLLASPKAKKGELVCGLYDTSEDEASAIGDFIAERWQEGLTTSAVLVRKRSQIPLIEEALRSRRLPVEVVGVGGLLLTPEVADLRATLEVMVNPEAGNSLMRLLTGARWRIGAHDLVALSRYAGSLVKTVQHVDDKDQDEDVRSIIDALDQIENAPRERFSGIGFDRLLRLSRELSRLRRSMSASLPDLISETEYAIGIDLEVAAHPESSVHSRAHLDRFLDEAVDFAQGGGGSAMLRSFLSYLQTASQTERGLKPGEVEVSTSAVQILTIHGAKGLEWDVVVVAGLTEGSFPSRDRGDDNWLRRAAVLPFPLRGDHLALPVFGYRQANNQAEVDIACDEFALDCAAHAQHEEIRLGYVAITRAKHSLLCTSSWWGNGKNPTGPSRLFESVREVAALHGVIASDAVEPVDGANPVLASRDGIKWPVDPLGERRTAVTTSAGLVENAIRKSTTSSKATNLEQESLLKDAKTLLQEFAGRDRSGGEIVSLPTRLSVSALIELSEDPIKLAQRIRRPIPSEPNRIARRGTAFHRWIEEQFGSVALLDIDEIPGSADEGAITDVDLTELQSAWNRSAWANRSPIEVEVPFETQVDSIVLRGRIDAIYQNTDGTYDVVDWKTGKPKQGESAQSAALQLAAYRLAWAKIKGIDPSQVTAAFHYVRQNITVRPADLKTYEELTSMVSSLPSIK
jgi:DNA helicase-2/ATP-dependent DNA helicase PcrA